MRVKTLAFLLLLVGSLSALIWVALLLVTFQQQQNGSASSISSLSEDRGLTEERRKLQAYLETAQDRIKELEDQIQEFQKHNSNNHNKNHNHNDNNDCPKSDNQQKKEPRELNDDEEEPFVSQNPVCQLFGTGSSKTIPHASAVWTQQISQIHKASQLSNDHRFDFSDFTAQLLHLVSPRLHQSVKTTPTANWPKVDEILRVAHARYQYITTSTSSHRLRAADDPPPPRPVKIVIMGGSLLVGMNCRKIIRDLGLQMRLPLGDCAWGTRLERLLNQFLLGGTLIGWNQRDEQFNTHYIVQVTKIAMGGTNTQTGTKILEYDLIPDEAKNPDIIINAYATNDMHIITMLEAQSGNATLRDRVFDMTQDFVRRVMDYECVDVKPPLMIHMDDYLGNEQRTIWATTELSQGIQVLANYYGFASVSYSDVVREWVYGDTHEYWFSPEGWWDTTDSTTSTIMTREIHPNMGMHIVAAWVMAYNLLHITTTFCSLEGWNLSSKQQQGVQSLEYTNTHLNNLPVLTGNYVPLGKPKPHAKGLPPPLTKTLSLENVSQLWQEQSNQQQSNQQQADDSTPSHCSNDGVKCPFSWLSGISNEITKPEELEAYFMKYTQLRKGDWTFQEDHHKLGIVPHSTMSPFVLELEAVTQPIRKVTIFYMKSYGTKWADSKVQTQVWKQRTSMGEFELLQENEFVGYHDKHTSETYTEAMKLKDPVEAGATLRIRVTLMTGATFKIMGFAICS